MTRVVGSLSPPKVDQSWGRLVRSGFIAAMTCVLPLFLLSVVGQSWMTRDAYRDAGVTGSGAQRPSRPLLVK